jgi:hypothetical protein
MSHMSSAAQARGHCPQCGAELWKGDQRCWLCSRQIGESAAQKSFAPLRPSTGNQAWQFSLGSLFVVMTIVAVGCGLFATLPGLGILFAIFAVPAGIRTVMDATKHQEHGAPLGPVGKLASFLVSLLVIIAAVVAGGIAGLGMCYAGTWTMQMAGPGGGAMNPWAMPVANFFLLASMAAMVAAGYGVLWLTRPRE